MQGFSRGRSLAAAIAVGSMLIFGCGEEDSDSDAASVEPVDIAAFEGCIFEGSLEVGIYEQLDDPAAPLQELATETGSALLAATKADDGFVYFYVPDDPATVNDLAPQVESEMQALAAALSEADMKGFEIGDPSVSATEGMAVGLVPFSKDSGSELQTETLADIETCTQ